MADHDAATAAPPRTGYIVRKGEVLLAIYRNHRAALGCVHDGSRKLRALVAHTSAVIGNQIAVFPHEFRRMTPPPGHSMQKYAILLSLFLFANTTQTALASSPLPAPRSLYAVSQAPHDRGSISVYDIDAEHRLIKTIKTVPNIADVRGATASAITGRLYVAYRDESGTGMIYCLNLYDDSILWNRAISPGVDRLAINPDGRLLYVPTWEWGAADYINVVDASSGDVVKQVRFSNRSHDTQYPLSGPIFQETKADDGSGKYLYLIDPANYAVSQVGPYSGILGPYAVDRASAYVVNNVMHLWGMQVANLKTGQIITASIPDDPPDDVRLLHGIGWLPDQSEVWENSTGSDPHVHIWDVRNPMAPVWKGRLTLQSGRGSHWLTFTIKGDYGYVAPTKNSTDGTEIFDTHSHASVGVIASSEDMLEIDFADGKVSQVGDQYGIGR